MLMINFDDKVFLLLIINFVLLIETCSTPSETEFRKVYSDWCHQFEKYKSDMKRWQLRQSVSLD